MAMEDLLEDAGHVVVGTAASKNDAIAVANATSPDLVFVDVHLLDGPTGLDIAEHLREVEGTMVVFMTANAKKVPDVVPSREDRRSHRPHGLEHPRDGVCGARRRSCHTVAALRRSAIDLSAAR